MQGEAASAGGEAAASYLEDLAKINDESGYTKQQIFNGDETAFLYVEKRCHLELSEPERSQCLGSELQAEDKLSLLLWANAAGDFKLKPVSMYHFENASDLKN